MSISPQAKSDGDMTRDYYDRIYVKSNQAYTLLHVAEFVVLWAAMIGGVLPNSNPWFQLTVLFPPILLACLIGQAAPAAAVTRHLHAAVMAYVACAVYILSQGQVEFRPGILIILLMCRESWILFTAAATFAVTALWPDSLSPFLSGTTTLNSWPTSTVVTIAVLLLVFTINNRGFVHNIVSTALARLSRMKNSLAKQRVSQEIHQTQLNLILLGVERAGEESREMLSALCGLLQAQERRIAEQEREALRLAEVGGQADRNVVEMRQILDELSAQTREMHSQGQAGAKALEQLRDLFQSIVDKSADILVDFQGCSALAEEISLVLGTVDAVNRATRLLALNAAVEAEKAGERGRGFGVLAQEMRRLAQAIESSLKEIEFLLRDIDSAISAGAHGAEQFVEEVRRSSQSTDLMTQQIDQVLSAGRAVEPLFQEGRTQIDDQMRSVTLIARLTTQADASNRSLSLKTKTLAAAVNQLEQAIGRVAGQATGQATGQAGPTSSAPERAHDLDRLNAVTTRLFSDYVSHLRRQYSMVMMSLAGGLLGVLAVTGKIGLGPALLTILSFAYALGKFRQQRYAYSAFVIPVLFPLLAQAASEGDSAQFGLTALVLAGVARDRLTLAGFTLGAVGLYLFDTWTQVAPPVIAPILWIWGALIGVFYAFAAIATHSEVWRMCGEQAVMELDVEQSYLDAMTATHYRNSNMSRLLDEIGEFCVTLESSGSELQSMGQEQEESNRLVIEATVDIVHRSEMVLGDCRNSSATISQLRTYTHNTLSTSEKGEAGVRLGRELLETMDAAAIAVQRRLQIVLGRKEQLVGHLKSLRKTAERVRIVSFHAAMEAEGSAGSQDNFRYVADECRDLGNRLDVSALNIERTLRRIETLVTQNMASLDLFCREIEGSGSHLERVDQSLGGTRSTLNQADEKLQLTSDLLLRQESHVRNLQDSALTMEQRQQGGVTDRSELQSILTALSTTLEQVRWAAAGSR